MFNWDSLTKLLSRAHTWTGIQTFVSAVFNTGVSGTAIDTDSALTANSDTLLASQKAVKAHVAAQIAAIPDPLLYKGVIDCSASPNYPAADAGNVYVVSVAGLIGGGSGISVVAGDLLLCKVDGSLAGTQAAVGANWDILEKNIDLSDVTITGGTITGITDLVVADGGTGASTLTDHGVLVGSGTDAVTALVVGTNGQVLVGSTGADPVFATITDGEGIDTTLGAGTLTIACEDTSETNKGVVELATNAEALTGTDTARAITPDDLHYVLDNSGTRFTNLLSNSQWMAMSGSTLENVGGDLAVNGAFTSDTDWVKDVGWTIAGGVGVATTASAAAALYQTYAGFVAGQIYKISTTVSGYSGGTVTMYHGDLYSSGYTSGQLSGNGTMTLVFEAPDTSATFGVITIGGSTTLNVDDITFYKVTPGYVAADTLAPDTMTKTPTLDLHQYWNAGSANTYGYGTYLLKATKGAAGAEYLNFGTSINYRDCQGKSVTLGCWVYSVSANDNVKLSIHDGLTEVGLSSSYVTNDALTWVELTATLAAGATALTPRILFDGDSSDVAYISHPTLVRGSSIGSGNYQPIPNEEILCQSNITLTGYTATTSAADGIINLEAASSGMIGKGVKAVLVKAYGKDSAAGDGVGFDVQSASGVEDGISVDTQVNNIKVQQQGIVKCDANGDIYFDHRGSGASALTVDIKVVGIRP